MARHGSGLHQWRCGNGNSNLTPAQVVQVDVIVALQSTLGLRKNAPIATLMRVVSVLGTGRVVFPACIACTWFWDVEVGTALQELLVFILVVMAACKTAFKMPRCVICGKGPHRPIAAHGSSPSGVGRLATSYCALSHGFAVAQAVLCDRPCGAHGSDQGGFVWVPKRPHAHGGGAPWIRSHLRQRTVADGSIRGYGGVDVRISTVLGRSFRGRRTCCTGAVCGRSVHHECGCAHTHVRVAPRPVCVEQGYQHAAQQGVSLTMQCNVCSR